ncbi:MAG: hypothetical protein WEH44_05540 [Pirellulaceae bacterium]
MATIKYYLLLGCFAFAMAVAMPRAAAGDDSPAVVVAQDSFKALMEGQIDEFVAYLHAADVNSFAKATIEVVELAEKSDKPNVTTMFSSVGSFQELKQMNSNQVVAAFLKTATKDLRDAKDLLKEVKLNVLGEIADGKDRTIVVSRMVFAPRVTVVEKHNGTWKLRMDADQQEQLATIKRSIINSEQEVLEDLLRREIQPVEVIGVIPREDESLVVCRSAASAAKGAPKKVMAVSIREKDKENEFLAAEKRPKLEAALKERFTTSWNRQKELLQLQLDLIKDK